MQSSQLHHQVHLKTMADVGGEKQKKAAGSARGMLICVGIIFVLAIALLIYLT